MARFLLPAVSVFGIGCGAASYTMIATAASPTPVSDVFRCVRERIPQIGFSQSSVDVDEHRVSAQRYNEAARRPDVRFRRLVDVLEIDVRADTTGETTLVVQSKTFAEYVTERGQTFLQESASERARTAGQSVLDSCGH